jgi:TetR/AcrR family transcriptional repressor of nem operon
MRYPKEQKAETRQRIIDVASRSFRREGVGATGVVPLMKQAGLTHGGFYAHFPSKEALVAETVRAGFDETMGRLQRVADRYSGDEVLPAIIGRYLHPLHRDHPENGCMAAALGPELARGGDEVRAALAEGSDRLVQLIATHLPSKKAGSTDVARSIVTVMMGALVMARATVGSVQSQAYLDAGTQTALALAGLSKPVSGA